VVAAKQLATVDQIGRGRLGVNVVCGWNEDEFQMFGVTKKDHEARYEQGEEWWSIVTRIWSGGEPFDFEGKHYHMEQVQGSPLPYGDEVPLMMNAGSSQAGRAFALQFSNMHFDAVRYPQESAARVAETKRRSTEAGRSIQVWTPIGVVCRPSRREAAEFTQHIVEHADVGAVGHIVDLVGRDGPRRDDEGAFKRIGEAPIERQVLARGNFCAIGDPDQVVTDLATLQSVGFDGLALNFVNYLDEIDYFVQEVLPRLEARGLRMRTE
jgi:alkanesulfonate monooxygenase SsuD/methylene tetrahydromethanopterin reductase-like flavin-dependent oxidoreductase (luciferase family)